MNSVRPVTPDSIPLSLPVVSNSEEKVLDVRETESV